MDLQTFREARQRAEAARAPVSRAHHEALDRARIQAQEQKRLLSTATSDGPTDEYRLVCYELYRAEAARLRTGRECEERNKLVSALSGLTTGWIVTYPGVGTGGAHFFVRSYALEGGTIASYDPFWVEALVHDLEERKKLEARTSAPPSSGPNWAKACFELAKPFGDISEAAIASCGACRRPVPVIGCKDLAHWREGDDDDDRPYAQELSALCLACLRLTLIARREDPKPVKLHP